MQWHRAGFRWYWSMLSRVRKTPGRKKISKEIRELIFKMVAENPNWGAPRVHGELLMLGFDVLGTNRFTLDETCTQRPRSGATLANLSA